MIKFWSIAKNTFLQTIRQPIFGLLVFITFATLVLALPLSQLSMGADYEASDRRMYATVGLGTLLWWGMWTAAFCASAAMTREINDKTALTVISKPVARASFVLGKFAGLAMAVSLAYYLGSLVFMLAVRHGVVSAASVPINWPVIVIGCGAFAVGIVLAAFGNYMFGWSFMSATIIAQAVLLTVAMGAVSVIGVGWEITPLSKTFGPECISGPLVLGMVLMYMAVILLTAVAVAFSTRAGQLLTLLLTLVVLVAGAAWPAISANLKEYLPGGEILSWALPNLTVFFPLDALARNQAMPLGWVTLYFFSYLAAMLALAIGLFQTRELAAAASASSMPGAVALLSGLGRLAGIVTAVAVAVMLTQAGTYTARGWISVAVAAALAGAMYAIFSAFGRGRQWAYWVTLLIAAGVLIYAAGVLWLPDWPGWLSFGAAPSRLLLSMTLSAVVILLLVLPKTHRHFKSSLKTDINAF
jgi:ABC-type transport system involved in multi-copper enzyme maturation permease subunit